MITGYNTDVRHNDVVFHVQTEDKGASNPFIESLVYVGGQVLASKRASYAELLAAGKDDKAIVTIMDHQHRTMIAAIRHGKFDEKLQALTTGRQTPRHIESLPEIPDPDLDPHDTLSRPAAETQPRIPLAALASLAPLAPLNTEPPPAPRPVPASPLAAAKVPERSLDQVILEYLTSEADQEHLLLFLEGEPRLSLGEVASVALRTSSSRSGRPIAGAQVSVKMISTVAEPRMLAAGHTNDDGGLELLLDIPPLTRGTAALIITAISDIGRAELKQLL